MSIRGIRVEIDEGLLAAAQKLLGTATIRDTIEEAFREILRIDARRAEVKALSTMDGMDLADPSLMPWRPEEG